MNEYKNNLKASFDTYGDFLVEKYYCIRYGTLPSNLSLELDKKPNRKHMEELCDFLDLRTYALSLTFRKWHTGVFSDSDPEKDYCSSYFFESSSKKLFVNIFEDSEDRIIIDFYYDATDKEVEEWVIATNIEFRKNFARPKVPQFKVLIAERDRFQAEKVDFKNFSQVDLSLNYNDDFLEVNDTILEAFEDEKSGVILLFGEPGTGKTSYIKHLISNFKTTNFIFIQNDLVKNLLKPSFISFLLHQRNATLVIEDAEKVVLSREENTEDSVVSTILQLTDGLFSDYLKIKIICTFNSNIGLLDRALLRKGRMIAKYEFKKLDRNKSNKLVQMLYGEETKNELTLAEIYYFKNKKFENITTKQIGF